VTKHPELGDMILSFCVQARSRSYFKLRSLVRYQAWTLEDKFHISARPCIVFYQLYCEYFDTKMRTTLRKYMRLLSKNTAVRKSLLTTSFSVMMTMFRRLSRSVSFLMLWSYSLTKVFYVLFNTFSLSSVTRHS
jgi:hypothetical protein